MDGHNRIGERIVSDPIANFRSSLRRLRKEVGGPTYKELEECAGLLGEKLKSSTISDLLESERMNRWPTVRVFVMACQKSAERRRRNTSEAMFDLVRWQDDYNQATGRSSTCQLVSGRTARDGVMDHFAHFTTERRIFHHRAPLVGREQDEATLRAALDRDEGSYVVILSGPGGRGKSRLAFESLCSIADSYPERPIVVLGSHSSGTNSRDGLPDDPSVILVEDAQRDRAGLCMVLSHARRISGTRVVVTCRPWATESVYEAVVLAGFDRKERDIIELPPLELSASRELVQCQSSAAELTLHEDLAEALSITGCDCPLVTVIAISMIATGTLTARFLELDHGFRQQILANFGDVMRDGIPGITGDAANEILATLTSLAPVSIEDADTLDKMAEFIGLPKRAFLTQMESLFANGVLLERNGFIRIVPDILGDVSLERAAVRMGKDTGYVRQLWESFGERVPVKLCLNLAELNSNINLTDDGIDLFGSIWPNVESAIDRAYAYNRGDLVMFLHDLVHLQPARVINLAHGLVVELRTDQVALDDDEITAVQARGILSVVLGIHAVHSISTRQRALDLLWELARQGPQPMSGPFHRPLDVLKKFAQYGPDCDPSRQTAILAATNRWLNDSPRTDDVVTPFDVLAPLMTKEVMPHLVQHAATPGKLPSSYLVEPKNVVGIRAHIRSLAFESAVGADTRWACAAVQLLKTGLDQPYGIFANKVAVDALREQWCDEDARTLTTLVAIADVVTEPLIRISVREIASHLAWYATESTLVSDACNLIVDLDRGGDADLLTVEAMGRFPEMIPRGSPILSNPAKSENWDFAFTYERQHSQERRELCERVWASLEEPESVIECLDERLRTVHAAWLRTDQAGPLVHGLVQARPERAQDLLDALQRLDNSPLSIYEDILRSDAPEHG